MSYFFRSITTVLVALFVVTSAIADTISPQEASQHIGEYSTVIGVVRQVSYSRKGTTFINFGSRFPNQVFYAVIFKRNAGRFSNTHTLEGRTVAITGTIDLYKGKPQIILRSGDQIEIQ